MGSLFGIMCLSFFVGGMLKIFCMAWKDIGKEVDEDTMLGKMAHTGMEGLSLLGTTLMLPCLVLFIFYREYSICCRSLRRR